MTHFLVLISDSGNIIEIKWSNPVYLFPRENMNFADFFEPVEISRIHSSITGAKSSEDRFFSMENAKLSELKERINLCFMHGKTGVLVFGIDSSVFPDEDIRKNFKGLSHRFLACLMEKEEKGINENSIHSRHHFEKIQTLNNKLVNTQRMLEKANTKLNELNRDLNNKLVKDSLTGLLSRYQYRSEIESMIAKHPDEKGIFTFIDIDGFKEVNDKYGHSTGDKYLKEFADRLKSMPLENLLAMRIAGDEFGIYTHVVGDDIEERINGIWNTIKNNILKEEIVIDNIRLKISLSAGMSVYGKDTKEIYELIEFADFAMYCAKRSGKNTFRVFDHKEYTDSKVYKGS